MKKLLILAALVGAFSFLPVNSAQAGTVVVDTGPRAVRHVVVHHRPVVRVGYVHRCRPVLYRRAYRPCRVWGPRRVCRPYRCGIGIGIRI